ncbi:hypothetical protein PAXRUDRAFT_154382 [Paxillus rubicundulus Ve08.2h10]|uniref:Uncharacterized protein n=1 Tax=Paxillus rubicundulus Ve08.2h10 TaxID=930991 RepID=A0A0D0DD27_9AGAM|nr:hypothetical protein PAXRUDRAFT_154382 [Paxillus rubicundulus Ve08.2h10]
MQAQKRPVDLLQIWHKLDFITAGLNEPCGSADSPPSPNIISGLIHLTLARLSVILNLVVTEHVFSQFGIILIHSHLHNYLSSEKVHKQALVYSDTIAQYSSICHVK